MDEKRNGCEVCFHDFDHRERRPRVVPCGHTFCSKCISDNFKEHILLCPMCRKEHHAETNADFPVNFKLESILFEGMSIPSTPDEISSPTTDQPKAISKKLKSLIAELSSGMESKATANKDVRSQLHQYESLLSEKEIVHHQIKEKHSVIVQRNDDIIQIIRKERARIAEALKEEEEETQRMKIVNDKLHAANTPHEVVLALEEADHCYDVLDTWNQESQENFPNVQLLKKSVVLVEQSQVLLQPLPRHRGEAASAEPTEVTQTDHLSENMTSFSLHHTEASSESINENESSEESSLLNPKLSIQEKVKRAVENASFSKKNKTTVKDIHEKSVQTEANAAVTERLSKEVQTETDPDMLIESLRTRSRSVMELIKKKRLFAVQEFEGRRRFAQISLQEKNRMVLHHLNDQEIPSNAHLLKHNDVLKLINVSSRLVFLELRSEEKNKTLGKLYIRLSPGGKRAHQFALLCSGQNGPSYVNTNILEVSDKGNIYECVRCGDYENLGGEGGRALVPDVLEEMGGVFKRPLLAGTVWGYGSDEDEAKAAQFFINTRDIPGTELDFCFGMVEEGLPILRDAIDNHRYIKSVIFSDAGLVLDI